MDENGREIDLEKSIIADVLRSHKKVSPMQAELLLREAYDMTFGIFDHVGHEAQAAKFKDPAARRPLAVVEMHPIEDTSGAVRLEEAMTTFAQLKIADKFGISFPQYLMLPHHYARQMVSVAEKLSTKENKAVDAAMSSFNNS